MANSTNQSRAKLAEYEKRILADRQLLNELLDESEEVTSEAVKKRIDHLQDEVRYMEQQLVEVRKAYGLPVGVEVVGRTAPGTPIGEGQAFATAETSKLETSKVIGKDSEAIEAKSFDKDSESIKANAFDADLEPIQVKPSDIKASDIEASDIEASGINDHPTYVILKNDPDVLAAMGMQDINETSNLYGLKRKKKAKQSTQASESSSNKSIWTQDIREIKDLEKMFGRSVMGIAASALIFVSLILFAGALVPIFGEGVKVFVLFLASFLFFGVGFYKMQKEPNNKFYLALTACGVGETYISLILANAQFEVLPDIPLYILIALWSVGVCYLSRKKNQIFHIIGGIGIAFAVYIGTSACTADGDVGKFTAIVIFYIISGVIFNVASYQKDVVNNLFMHVVNLINAAVFVLAANDMYYEELDLGIVGFIVSLIVIASIVYMLWGDWYRVNTSMPVLLFFYMLFLDLSNSDVWGDNVGAILSYVMFIAIAIAIERKVQKLDMSKWVSMFLVLAGAAMTLKQNEVILVHGFPWLVIIPLFIYGFYRKNFVFKYASMVIFIIYQYIAYVGNAITLWETSGIERFLTGALIVAMALITIYKKPEQYDKYLKYVVHTAAFLLIAFVCKDLVIDFLGAEDIGSALAYTFATVYNLLMMKYYSKDFNTGISEGKRMYRVLNFIMMWMGSIYLFSVEDIVFHCIVVVVVVVAFMVNVLNYLNNEESIWYGIYVGAKFALLLVLILASFEAANYVISTALLILAIASIAIGFKWEYKSLRVFGLVLSMVSIFKLLVVDINYSNSLGNAVSFFISGVLCFAISMIYNYIDKKMEK